jgi:hypothetical protein
VIAFDTNILTEVLLGNPPFVARVAAIPGRLQAVKASTLERIEKAEGDWETARWID